MNDGCINKDKTLEIFGVSNEGKIIGVILCDGFGLQPIVIIDEDTIDTLPYIYEKKHIDLLKGRGRQSIDLLMNKCNLIFDRGLYKNIKPN